MRNTVYNIITLIFTVLSIVMLVFVFSRLSTPLPEDTSALANLPTVAPDLPTLTPTHTHTATYPPTFTPTFTLTLTPTVPASLTPTVMPSSTITPSPTITDTPLATFTAVATSTEVLPSVPTATAPSPYVFAKRSDPRFVPNFANTLGCAWQGLGGQVFDILGNESTTPYRIHVYSATFDNVVNTGSNSIYGPASGWEMQVGIAVTADTYFVELQSQFGTKLSEPVQVTFPMDCTKNVALVDFIQVQQLP